MAIEKLFYKIKMRLFNSNVLSALLYSNEFWNSSQQQERRIRAFENNCLQILNIDWRYHVTNQKVRSISGQLMVTDIIRQWRWWYLGYVTRMKNDRIPRQILERQPQGNRRRGRPKNTMHRRYRRVLSNIHTTIQPYWEDILVAVHIRDDWRLFTDILGASGDTGGYII